MGKANVTSANWLKLLFNATAITNIADNAAGSPITQIAVALHTADPGATGTQTTSEATYGSYARVNVNRNSGGWTYSSSGSEHVNPTANIDFPACTSGTNTITHFSVGKTGGGATDIFYSGTVTPNISVSSGVTPRLTTASSISEA